MKRAIITGASKGLGNAFADRLVADGWQVVGIDREPHPVSGGFTDHIQCDLSDLQQISGLIERLRGKAPFDLVVLNAGASATGRFEAIGEDAIQRLVNLNTIAPMQIAAGMAANGSLAPSSALLFIASLSHFSGYPGAAVYAATKDALSVYARSIRKPFARQGIRVSCAFPGPLATDHAERHAPSGANPAKRMEPQDAVARILPAALAGRPVIVPGNAARVTAIAGRLFPGPVTRVMRRIIYDRLDREVW